MAGVVACIVAYQEGDTLPGCLQSIAGKVARMVVVDGARALYPHEVPWSTDPTREIARAFGAEVVGCPANEEGQPRPWADEMEQRNAYLARLQQGEWCLLLDADERLEGWPPEPEEGLHYLLQGNALDGQPVWWLRLWPFVPGMAYRGAHPALWHPGGHLVHQRHLPPEAMSRVPPERCRIVHLHNVRHESRQRVDEQYERIRGARERPYRRLYGV